ncbi:MAG: hypothetical protein GEU89_14715 [Kiloniellaceae bacterium]|nr:hypothetical protein [Kiloniellaceae bacterium]
MEVQLAFGFRASAITMRSTGMRTLKALAVAFGATAMLPAAAMAQQSSPTTEPPATEPPAMESTETPSMESTDSTQAATPDAPAVLTEQKSDEVLSDSYIGAKVVASSTEGVEEVGKIAELVLGPDDKIVGVIVDVGGFLGVGAKPVGLSWTALTEEAGDGEMLLKTSLTRAELEEAPEFKTLSDIQSESDQQTTAPVQ